MRRSLQPVVAAAVLTVMIGSAAPATANPRVGADSVLEWNEIAVDTMLREGTPAVPDTVAVPGPVGALYLTYVHRAVYDAVQHSGPSTSIPAAVATAAHTVLSFYFPAQDAQLDGLYETFLAEIPDGVQRDRGVAAGENAAEALLRAREGDGLNGTPLPLPSPVEPGVWTPAVMTPPITAATASWLGSVQPFVLDSPSELRPPAPPALTSHRYARAYEEVRVHGGSATAVPEEANVARFWSDNPWVQSQHALRLHAVNEDLGARAAARLFALANTAGADALIACADAKFAYNFWRPFSAIPGGDTDGNPATVGDPEWTPVLSMTPNFPEYPSNHSCATTAIVTVVDRLDGRSPFSYTVTSTSPPASPESPITHTFTSAEQVIREVANARVWGGIHFRFSTDAGTAIGRAVAARVLASEGLIP